MYSYSKWESKVEKKVDVKKLISVCDVCLDIEACCVNSLLIRAELLKWWFLGITMI